MPTLEEEFIAESEGVQRTLEEDFTPSSLEESFTPEPNTEKPASIGLSPDIRMAPGTLPDLGEVFSPPKFVADALDSVFPSFKSESPEMKQLVGMLGLEPTRAVLETVSEKLKGAVGGLLSPGGVALGIAAPVAPAIVGGIVAATSVPGVVEGVSETAQGIREESPAGIVGGAMTTGLGGLGVVGGGLGMAIRLGKGPVKVVEESLPLTKAALEETLKIETKSVTEVETAAPKTEQAPKLVEKPQPAAETGGRVRNVAPAEILPPESAAEGGAETAAPPSEPTPAGKVEPAGSLESVNDLFTPESLVTPAAETVGLKPPSSDPMAVIQKVKDTFQRLFTVRGDLPEPVMGLKRQLEASQNAIDTQVRMGERDLMAALKDVYGLNELQVAGGGSRRIPPAAVQMMDEYLKGRVANPTTIPAPIRTVLDRMRGEIDAESTKVMATLNRQRAALKPGTANYESLSKLIDKIQNNLDVYVHRSYKFFDSEKGAPQWYADLPLGVRQGAEDFLINNSPTPLTREQSQSLLLDWLSDLKDPESATSSGKLGSKDLSIFMRKKVIDPELRAVLGEYRNPLINYAKSVSKMGDWIAKQKFLDEVKRRGMGDFLFEEGMNPHGFNTQIAAEGSSTLSPLNGLRTTQEIADAFKNMDGATDHGVVARAYLTLNAWTKFAATGLSAMTQARNLVSRPLMAGMAGHWQAGKIGRSARAIYEDFAGSDATWRGYLDRLYKLGVIGDTARSGELKAIIRDASLRDVDPAQLYSWSIGRAIKKYGYKIPAEIYRLSDELGNVFGFENERAIQQKINPSWGPERIDAEAAKIVRDIYPTYSETPEAIKSFRKVAVVGPFVTFPYQMFRTTWNALGRSFYEMRSANPVERAQGYKRLASQMAVITATYAMQETGKQLLGISSQQEQDFRRFQPPWSKNSKFLFTGRDEKTGELSAINLSYTDPYSYITDPLIAIASSVKTDKPMFEIFAETTKEMFRPWVSEQMLAKALIEARNGKTDTGREIVNPTDTPIDAFQKQAGHVLKTLEPGTMQRVERRILPAIRNEQPIYGRKLEVGPEIARELSGFAVEKFNFKNGLAFRASDFVDKDKASESIFHKTVSRTETTTPDDILMAYKESDARRFQVWAEMQKDYMAAVRQGVSPRDARKVMKARGMSDNDADAISAGRYEPMPISDQTRKRARERNRKLPLEAMREFRQESKKQKL